MFGPLLLTLAPTPQEPTPQAPAPSGLFRVEISPAADLWCEVRYLAGREEEVPAEHPLASAVGAARKVDPLLSSPLAWGGFDALGTRAEPGLWLAAIDDVKLPKWVLGEGAKRPALRAGLEELLAALDSAAPAWIETEWPAREAALVAQRDALREAVGPDQQSAAIHRIERWLALSPPREPAQVLMVTRTVPPGGSTVVSRAGPLCLVAAEGRGTSLLAEVVIHEALHVLDGRPERTASLFAKVRVATRRAGVLDVELQRAYVHTLFFLCAAEIVRGVLDPEHVDYGVSEGYYAEVGRAYEVLLPLWNQVVAGELTHSDLAVQAAVAAAEQQKQAESASEDG